MNDKDTRQVTTECVINMTNSPILTPTWLFNALSNSERNQIMMI